MMLRVATVKNL